MKIEKSGNLTVLHLKENKFKERILFLLGFSLFHLICGFLLLVMLIFSIAYGPLLASLLIFVICGIYLWISYAYFKQCIESETLTIGDGLIILEKNTLHNSEQQVYTISSIKDLRFNYQTEPKTEHPLMGSKSDFLGFGANEKIITQMHRDESIAFDYEGKTVFFGKRLYSWDFEKIFELIYNKSYTNEEIYPDHP